ncbi:MAG: hypothetical protein ACI4HO_09155 [Ruminococcus sp.]
MTCEELDKIRSEAELLKKLEKYDNPYDVALIATLNSRIEHCQATINLVDNPEYRNVLSAYYIKGLSINAIARNIGYSYRQISRIKSAAVKCYLEKIK